ncbi:hypothetical protein Hamer_G007481, partial [Homarus americanus]
TLFKKAVLQIKNEERSEQRGASVSVHHYDKHCDTKYKHGRNKCLTWLSDVQRKYRPCWGFMRNPYFALTQCRIYGDNRKHSLQYYTLECRPIRFVAT